LALNNLARDIVTLSQLLKLAPSKGLPAYSLANLITAPQDGFDIPHRLEVEPLADSREDRSLCSRYSLEENILCADNRTNIYS
jgi:hypothetical protein